MAPFSETGGHPVEEHCKEEEALQDFAPQSLRVPGQVQPFDGSILGVLPGKRWTREELVQKKSSEALGTLQARCGLSSRRR